MSAHEYAAKPQEVLFLENPILKCLASAPSFNLFFTRETLARLLAGPEALAEAPKEAESLRGHPAFGRYVRKECSGCVLLAE